MLKIALVGAPHTGKSQLACALNDSLESSGQPAVVIVVADTPALQADRGSCGLTLLMGLDFAVEQQNLDAGASTSLHVQEAADQSIRTALTRAGIPYQVVYGGTEERLDHALRALESLQPSAGTRLFQNAVPAGIETRKKNQPWVWVCDKCSDPQCEHRLLTDLLARRTNSV